MSEDKIKSNSVLTTLPKTITCPHCGEKILGRLALDLENFRLKHGWTQGEMATLLGITQPAYSKLTAGKGNISPDNVDEIILHLQRIAKVLDPGGDKDE